MAPAALRSGWVGVIIQATICLKVVDAFRIESWISEGQGAVSIRPEPIGSVESTDQVFDNLGPHESLF